MKTTNICIVFASTIAASSCVLLVTGFTLNRHSVFQPIKTIQKHHQHRRGPSTTVGNLFTLLPPPHYLDNGDHDSNTRRSSTTLYNHNRRYTYFIRMKDSSLNSRNDNEDEEQIINNILTASGMSEFQDSVSVNGNHAHGNGHFESEISSSVNGFIAMNGQKTDGIEHNVNGLLKEDRFDNDNNDEGIMAYLEEENNNEALSKEEAQLLAAPTHFSKSTNEYKSRFKEVMGDFAGPIFGREIEKGVSMNTLKGALIAGASLTLAANNFDPIVAAAVGSWTAYVAITPGSTGNVARAFGNVVWGTCTKVMKSVSKMSTVMGIKAPFTNKQAEIKRINGINGHGQLVGKQVQMDEEIVNLVEEAKETVAEVATVLSNTNTPTQANEPEILAEEARRLEIEYLLEEARIEKEAYQAEEEYRAVEAQIAEEERLEQEAELALLEEEQRLLLEEERISQEEERRVAEVKRLLEEEEKARLEEDELLAVEAKRLSEEEEKARLEEDERLAAEAKRLSEEEGKQRLEEDERLAAEAKRLSEEEGEKRLKEKERVRLIEEERLAEEASLFVEESNRKELENEEEEDFIDDLDWEASIQLADEIDVVKDKNGVESEDEVGFKDDWNAARQLANELNDETNDYDYDAPGLTEDERAELIAKAARAAVEKFEQEKIEDEIIAAQEKETRNEIKLQFQNNDILQVAEGINDHEAITNNDDTLKMDEGNHEKELDYQSYTVKQLKEILRSRGLKLSGRKAELIERLKSE